MKFALFSFAFDQLIKLIILQGEHAVKSFEPPFSSSGCQGWRGASRGRGGWRLNPPLRFSGKLSFHSSVDPARAGPANGKGPTFARIKHKQQSRVTSGTSWHVVDSSSLGSWLKYKRADARRTFCAEPNL